jgi:hypothetical protein
MALATLNGVPVLEAAVMLPKAGVWHAQVQTDGPTALGASVLAIGGVGFLGMAMRGGEYGGRAGVRLIGGAAGLSRPVVPAHYRAAQLRTPLKDVLDAAGETLSASTSEALLSRPLDWVLASANCAEALFSLLEGLSWRVLRDGSVWAGEEAWPEVKAAHEVLQSSASEDSVLLAMEAPWVMPGSTLDGRRVSNVQVQLTSDSLRSTVWFEP